MKNVIQVALVIVILILGYLLYESIQKPIRFQNELSYRSEITIEKLKEIRTCQVAYKSMHGKYTGSFDTLIDFIRNGQFKVVKQVGSYDDSLAVAQGKVYRDTVLITVLDSLFDDGYNINNLRYIPFSDKVEFEMGATILDVSKVRVPVFEAKAHNDIFLVGLDKQLIFNENEKSRINQKYPGIMVGSLTEANNNSGNWE